MKSKFVYNCGILDLTKSKQQALDKEYFNIQTLLREGKDLGLYSANKQQAQRFFKKIGKNRDKNKEYPLSLRNDLIRVEKRGTKLTDYWIKIPVKERRGGIWLPIKPYKEIDLNSKICESKIVRKNGKYILYLVIEKEIKLKQNYQNILAIDLGSRNVATMYSVKEGKTWFYGKKLREIRGWYYYLRKQLGKKKLLKKIRSLKDVEKRKVNDLLHKISRDIINKAKEQNAIIVLGDLRNHRKGKKWRKKSERKKSTMPSHKMKELIKYKALQEGIVTIEVTEHYTSKSCSVCGRIGKRRTQGSFKCECGYEDNADRNGAINIAKRVLWYIYNIGAPVNELRTEDWIKNYNTSEAIS